MIAALARYSLRRQMLLVLGLPSVVFVLCIAALFAHQSSRALDQALLERGRTMVRFLAPAAEYVLVSGNREALDALMARGLAQPDVVGVGFYDPGGEALAMLGEGLPPRLAAPVRTEGDEIRVDLADGAVGVEAAGEVDGAGAGFGQLQAGVDRVLHRVDADDDPAGLGGAVGPQRADGLAARLGELDGVPYLQLCENRPYDCLDAAEVDRLVLEIGGTGDEMERRMSAGGDLL